MKTINKLQQGDAATQLKAFLITGLMLTIALFALNHYNIINFK